MACDASDKTTTSTQTEPESSTSYPTVTVTASQRSMGRQPASLINSIATQIISEQYAWNVARFGPMPTGGGGSKMVPKGPNGEEGTYWVWFLNYATYDDDHEYPTIPEESLNSAYGRGSYDGPPAPLCGSQTAEWSDRNYKQAVWRESVQNIKVFGDSSCDYTVSDDSYNLPAGSLIGTIACDKWQDAKCYAEDLALMEFMECPEDGYVWFSRMAYCTWE